MAAKREIKCLDCEHIWVSGAKPENVKCPDCKSDNCEETGRDLEDDNVTLEQTVTIPKSRIMMAGFKDKDNPIKMKAEEERQEKLAAARQKNRKKRIIENAKLTPIEVRKRQLTATLRRCKKSATTYRPEMIRAWIKELKIIQNTPDEWGPNCVGVKKKKSGQELLEAMNLD